MGTLITAPAQVAIGRDFEIEIVHYPRYANQVYPHRIGYKQLEYTATDPGIQHVSGYINPIPIVDKSMSTGECYEAGYDTLHTKQFYTDDPYRTAALGYYDAVNASNGGPKNYCFYDYLTDDINITSGSWVVRFHVVLRYEGEPGVKNLAMEVYAGAIGGGTFASTSIEFVDEYCLDAAPPLSDGTPLLTDEVVTEDNLGILTYGGFKESLQGIEYAMMDNTGLEAPEFLLSSPCVTASDLSDLVSKYLMGAYTYPDFDIKPNIMLLEKLSVSMVKVDSTKDPALFGKLSVVAQGEAIGEQYHYFVNVTFDCAHPARYISMGPAEANKWVSFTQEDYCSLDSNGLSNRRICESANATWNEQTHYFEESGFQADGLKAFGCENHPAHAEHIFNAMGYNRTSRLLVPYLPRNTTLADWPNPLGLVSYFFGGIYEAIESFVVRGWISGKELLGSADPDDHIDKNFSFYPYETGLRTCSNIFDAYPLDTFESRHTFYSGDEGASGGYGMRVLTEDGYPVVDTSAIQWNVANILTAEPSGTHKEFHVGSEFTESQLMAFPMLHTDPLKPMIRPALFSSIDAGGICRVTVGGGTSPVVVMVMVR